MKKYNVSKEIEATLETHKRMVLEAEINLDRLKDALKLVEAMLVCDKAQTHKFVQIGSGERVAERCENCGYIHEY